MKKELYLVLIGVEDDVENLEDDVDAANRFHGPITQYSAVTSLHGLQRIDLCIASHGVCHALIVKESYCRGKEDQAVILKRRMQDTHRDIPVICYGNIKHGGVKGKDYDHALHWSHDDRNAEAICNLMVRLRAGELPAADGSTKAADPRLQHSHHHAQGHAPAAPAHNSGMTPMPPMPRHLSPQSSMGHGNTMPSMQMQQQQQQHQQQQQQQQMQQQQMQQMQQHMQMQQQMQQQQQQQMMQQQAAFNRSPSGLEGGQFSGAGNGMFNRSYTTNSFADPHAHGQARAMSVGSGPAPGQASLAPGQPSENGLMIAALVDEVRRLKVLVEEKRAREAAMGVGA